MSHPGNPTEAALRARGAPWDDIPHGFGRREQVVAEGHPLRRVRQVHGKTVMLADRDGPPADAEADALICATPGIAVAVATADCVPILLTTDSQRTVAAVHAGWRGTLAGIVAEAVATLRDRLGVAPGELHAALGPAIGPCCFELERHIAARFAGRFGSEIWSFWSDDPARPGKGRLDLLGVNELQLARAGIVAGRTQRVGPCTYCGGGGFASYRRDAADAGRQSSWIAPPPPP